MKRYRPQLSMFAALAVAVLVAVVAMAFIDYRRTPPVVEDTRTKSQQIADHVRDGLLDIFT